jgi:lysophospholipase L1-like esterase
MILRPFSFRATLRCVLGGALLSVGLLSAMAADFRAVRPVQRLEGWEARSQQIDRALARREALGEYRLLFVGDSLTDFWLRGNDPKGSGQRYGRSVWDESFNRPGTANYALNIGVAGDRTEHVLHRLEPKTQGGRGQLDALELAPEFIIVMIGINNTWAAEEPVNDSVFEGVRAVLAALQARKPRARIILQSLLPVAAADRNRDIVMPVNQRLQALVRSQAAGCMLFLDLYPAFVDEGGAQIGSYFIDGLHPDEAGYRVWRDRLLPFIEAARHAPAAAACR